MNAGLASLCATDERSSVVDVTAALTDDTGNLNPGYHAGDGVHLNTAGYALWITALREQLNSILGKKPGVLLECIGSKE
ncbi:MAG: hypothetical protein BWY09_01584 [Candidatus Hydrogenedentes bacterium ADurb.Bin179]|nr:MAG: hypothetical protein BWY09_01584 [Candidatus Hydrogenedentes bacterium ADurb.Bin179]